MFHSDLPKDLDDNLKNKIDFILKQWISQHKVKTRLVDDCLNRTMEAIFMNTESSKTN